ncbi:hypothetical protein AQUCO_01400782v1 [Aquilegia coerulea]|uniref:Uncharacterized protein n=1 Tax=Aquilegia coerulea TaxID=218851 RepID=A0A2G5DXZ8_AQUCA|nr:hypothetical protein AQUCO_01400782v1 [Aquilegia coerulea]
MVISLKCTHTIKPNQPTPNVQLMLPECDQVKPWTHPTTVYFYQPLCDTTVQSPIETLKSSLSYLLVHYYPFAGRLNWISGGRFVINCNEMGAEVTEAESDATIQDFGDFRPTAELGQLAPNVDYTKDISDVPLLLVQLTKLKCGGMCMGVALSHIIADGIGAVQFFSSLAKIARGEKIEILPYHDRSVIYNGDPLAKPCFDHIEFKAPPSLIGQKDNEKEEHTKETMLTMLKLTKQQALKLKDRANEGKTKDGSRDYSRFEAIAGHMWRCTCMARNHDYNQLTVFRMPMDFRNRLQPSLPPGYYGNAVSITTPMAKSGDLISSGLSYAAGKIRESVERASSVDYIKSYMDFLRSQPDITPFRSAFHKVIGGTRRGVYYGNPNLAITSWMGLNLYDADFGWGKPIYMGPAALNADGKSIIVPADDGSLIIPLRLQVAHMDDFEKFFYQDI